MSQLFIVFDDAPATVIVLLDPVVFLFSFRLSSIVFLFWFGMLIPIHDARFRVIVTSPCPISALQFAMVIVFV